MVVRLWLAAGHVRLGILIRLVSLNFAEFRVSRRAKTLNFAAFLLTRRVFELSEFLSETVDLRAGSWRVRGVMAELLARQSAASVAASGRPAQLLRCDLHYR